MTEVRAGVSADTQPTTPGDSGTSPGERNPEERTNLIVITAVLLGVAMTVWRAMVMLRGFFWQDDFLYVYRAANQGLFDYLTQSYNGHVMPGQFLLVWLVTRWAPLNWVTAMLPLIALQALAYILFWRLLVRVFGCRPAVLVPFSLFVASPLTLAATTWWAYALQLVPFQVALVGALHAHVGFLQTGNRRFAMHGVLWTVAGLLFWQKALLIVPVIVAVTVALEPGRLSARLVATWRRYRGLWLWYAASAGIYLVLYARAVTAADGLVAPGRDMVALADRMLADTFLPGALGGPWRARIFEAAPWQQLPELVTTAIWAGVATVVVIAGLWFGRSRALVAWLLLLLYLACDVVLVAAFRLQFIGPVIGEDVRYVADAVLVAALCAGLAFLRPRDPAAGAPVVRTDWATYAGLGIAVVFLAVATVTMAVASPKLTRDGAREYVRTAVEELRTQPGTVLYDGKVPEELMIAGFGDDARVSRVIGPLGLDVTFDRPTDDLQMLNERGVPRPVVLTDTTEAPPGPVPNCGYQANQLNADIALEAEPPDMRQVVRIGYFTNRSVVGTVVIGSQRVRVTFQAGLHHLYLTVPKPGQIVSVDLASTDSTLCVTDVVVGSPRPKV